MVDFCEAVLFIHVLIGYVIDFLVSVGIVVAVAGVVVVSVVDIIQYKGKSKKQ